MRKNQDISRLHAHKVSAQMKRIETLERNKPHVAFITELFNRQELPGTIALFYMPTTHCLTIKYVGLTVQWYAHLDKAIIHHGNDKAKHVHVDSMQLRTRLLHQGKKGFM